MKRYVLIILLMGCLSQTVVAEVVKPDVAARYAANLLGVSSISVSDNNISRAPSRGGVTADPDYYVFNNPSGGWVIISAEDRVTPIIGYSDTGSFETSGLPSNLKWWMDGVSESINKVRELDLEAPASVRRAWQDLSANRAPESTKKVLQTANWDQEEPYTLYTPYVSGENKHALVGCVATAMSIIMRYYQWPERGHGQIGGYTTTVYPTYIPAYSLDNHVYDWANMPLTDAAKKASAWTDTQLHEVAQLMYDCGVMVNMDYTFERGSASHEMRAVSALSEHMSYAESVTYMVRSLYTLDEWYALMKKEIDEDRVILYGGYGDAGGHAFVCDGYDTDGSKLHINWGWGGAGNGFYTLDLTITRNDGFPDEQGAVIGIVPDTLKRDSEENEPFVLISRSGFFGMQPYEWADMKQGSELYFAFGWVYSNYTYEGDVDFKVCLMDKEGTIKQEGWTTTERIEKRSENYRAFITEKTALEVTPELTDYFQLFRKTEGGSWRPVKGNRDLLPDVDGIYCGVLPYPVIIVPDDCSVGQTVKPTLTFGYLAVKSVSWKHNGKQIAGPELTLTEGTNVIRADVVYIDGSKGSIVRSVTAK